MRNTYDQCLFYLIITFIGTNAFVSYPLIADVVETSDSITHTEITGLGFIRTLARFFYDTRINQNNTNGSTVNEEEYFTTQHTIDDLYKLAHPEYNAAQIQFYSLPLKFVLDSVMTHNALVDFKSNTKILSAAHFDSEAFSNGSRRILQLRKTIVNNTRDAHQDLTETRELLGQLLHTLQDFYSHSNWVEMGNTDINDLIGVNETIGSVAAPDQATCTNNGCTKIEKTCSLWQETTLRNCPLVYYDCQNNILPEINTQHLLTSGYLLDQRYENGDSLSKPANVGKCSHGSVLDLSTNIPAIGGINKDSHSLLMSPHYDLHYQAVQFGINATERFLNNLRRDVGDDNFERLFLINPTQTECQNASDAVTSGQRFRFFTQLLSASLKEDARLITRLKNWIKKRVDVIKSRLTSIFSNKTNLDQPTYDLSDQGVDTKDVNNSHSAPYIMASEKVGRKKRLTDILRTRQ